jgi:hypothetical protein
MTAYVGTPIVILCGMNYAQTERRILAWFRQEYPMAGDDDWIDDRSNIIRRPGAPDVGVAELGALELAARDLNSQVENFQRKQERWRFEWERLRGELSEARAKERGSSELADKLKARDGECAAKARIIAQLESSLRRLERSREYQRKRDERNRATFMRMRDEVHLLREQVNPLKHGNGGDVREVIHLSDVIDIGTKHRGDALRDVADTDPTWVTWLERAHSTHRPSPKALKRALAAIARRHREAVLHVDIENCVVTQLAAPWDPKRYMK